MNAVLSLQIGLLRLGAFISSTFMYEIQVACLVSKDKPPGQSAFALKEKKRNENCWKRSFLAGPQRRNFMDPQVTTTQPKTH